MTDSGHEPGICDRCRLPHGRPPQARYCHDCARIVKNERNRASYATTEKDDAYRARKAQNARDFRASKKGQKYYEGYRKRPEVKKRVKARRETRLAKEARGET